jgi:CheY-like chemotaxis protein
MREMLRRALEKEEWTVAEASNGREALACVARQQPSLILLDLMMPEMDGFEFVAQLRESSENRNIPIVVLTAKEVSPEERARLNGQVAKIVQKGTMTIDEILRDLGALITHHVRDVTHLD